MSPRDALKMAQALDLDLVKVAPQAKPPVCKILDYGKYRFEMQKKEKEAKKNQKVIELKEIRLSLNIDTNDFNTKVNQAAKFLQQGHKVKVSIRFRGREMAHTSLGIDVEQRFAQALEGKAVVDKQPKLEGRSKRFKMTASGKIKRNASKRRHILTKKTTKLTRGLRMPKYVDKTNEATVRKMMPYGG